MSIVRAVSLGALSLALCPMSAPSQVPARDGGVPTDAQGPAALAHVGVPATVHGTLDAQDERVHPSSAHDASVQDRYVMDLPRAVIGWGVTVVVTDDGPGRAEPSAWDPSGPYGWNCTGPRGASVLVFTPVDRSPHHLRIRSRGAPPPQGIHYTVEVRGNVDLNAIHAAGCRWYGEDGGAGARPSR